MAPLRVPIFLQPVPAFVGVQLLALGAWFLISDEALSIALSGASRAPFEMGSVLAYGVLLLAFAAGAWLGERSPVSSVSRDQAGPFIWRLAHLSAIVLAAFSACYIAGMVLRSDLNVLAVIFAAQANIFKKVVYSSDSLSQLLIMGRHLVLAALITWCAAPHLGIRRYPTVPVIVLAAMVMFLFTSSRLTVMSLMIIGMLFWFVRRSDRERTWLRRAMPIIGLVALGLIFALGVWTRSLGTWATAGGGRGPIAAAIYELGAYLASPVNYSLAFVEDGGAFINGLGLDNFFNVVFTALNLPVDYSYRDAIYWYYDSRLDRIGLLGEWYAIAGPLFWIPTLGFGYLAGLMHVRFRARTLSGLLLYPVVLIAVIDSTRGFLLTENIVAANLLFLGSCIAGGRLLRVSGVIGQPTPAAAGLMR